MFYVVLSSELSKYRPNVIVLYISGVRCTVYVRLKAVMSLKIAK
jgi:hypothetical protein